MSTNLDEALNDEQAIAEEAAKLREGTAGLDRELFQRLWPLLRKPIPGGFIKTIGVVKGKPYDSTGVSSVQVQIERMDNVLGPLAWRDRVEYSEGGKLAHVTVDVIDKDGDVLVSRESWGGVNQASTIGNLHKGSYTNAAKLAFARVGPGHEVYLGATDLDPDVHEKAAAEQARPQRGSDAPVGPRLLRDDERERVAKAIEELNLGEKSVALLLASVGVEDIASMTTADAFELHRLIADKGRES